MRRLGLFLCAFVCASFGILAARPALAQLSIGIEVGRDTIRPSQVMNVEVTVSNTSGGSVANVSVQLDMPAGIPALNQNYASAGGLCQTSGNLNGLCDQNETMTWTLGTLPAGQRKSVNYVVVALSTATNGTVYTFNARALEGAVVRASASDSTTVSNAPIFDIALDESIDPVAPGANLTYTLSWGNISGGAVANATATLALPGGTTFVSASDGGSFGAGVVSWNLGNLAAGQGGTRQVTVNVGALGDGTLLRPVAQIQAPALLTARAAVVGAVRAAEPLRVEFESQTDPVRNGEWEEMQVTVTNVGGPSLDTLLEVRLDSGQSGVNQNYTTRNGICTVSGTLNASCDSSERLQFDIPPLGAGERYTTSFIFASLTGSASPPNGTMMTVRAEVAQQLAGQVGESALAHRSVRVESTRSLELAIDQSDDPIAPSSTLTYVASFGNAGAGTLVGANLSIPVPAGTTFVSASDGGIQSGGVISWNLGTLAPGQSGTRQFVVNVGALAEGELLRTTGQIVDSALNNVRAPSVVVVQSGSPLRLEIETGSNPVRSGDWGGLLFTVTNTGGSTIDTVLEVRQDEETAGFNQNFLTRDGICTVSGTLNASCDPDERWYWDLPPLAAGERITVSAILSTLSGSAAPPNGTLVPVRAEVYEPLAGAVGESRHSRHELRVQGPRTYDIAIDESDDPVAPGAPLTYVVSYGNITAATSAGTVLSVPVPVGTTFVSASGGGVFASGAVTWNLGAIPAGQGGTRDFTVNVGAGVPQGEVLRTVAQITDSAANAARAPIATVAQSASPLRVEIDSSVNPIRNGEYQEIQATVTNVGALAIDSVLEMRMGNDEALYNQNYLTRGGICTVSGTLNANCDPDERMLWDLPPLAPGERITVTRLFSSQSGSASPLNGSLMPVRAEVYESPVVAGTVGRSRVARMQQRVMYTRPYELELDESDDPVAPGTPLTYTATFSNVSAAPSNATTLSLPIPVGTTFVSATGGGVFASGVVTWTLGALPAAQVQTRQVVVNVGAGVAAGEVLRTEARLQDAAGNSARAPSTAVVQTASPLRVEIETGANPMRPAEWADLQVTVTNVGGTTFDGVLQARVDELITLFNQNYLTRGGICTVSGTGNANCDQDELVQWDLPPLAAGERTTVSMLWSPFSGSAGLPNGSLQPLRVEAFENVVGAAGRSRLLRVPIAVHSSPVWEVSLDDAADPVSAGADLPYTLTIGRVNGALSALPTLSFQVPAGTTFVSATNGGTHSNGVVTWNLPPLPAGQTGTRQVTVHVDPALPAGSVLRAFAQASDIAGFAGFARAATVVQPPAQAPVRVTVTATPDPARPSNTLDVQLLVQNFSASTLSGAILEARTPWWQTLFAQTLTTGGGICTVSGTLNTNCDASERVRWALPDIAPGSSALVSMPPTLTSTVVNGTLVRINAWVDSGTPQSAAKETVRVGFLDTDGDGLLDTFDNCGAVANPGQQDGDSDEAGDACDYCPTITNANQSDVDGDLVGDVCDNCVNAANPRPAAGFLTTNTWATLTGGQRDDDHDGYGNVCDAKFPGNTGTIVNANDTAQIRASIGKSRTGDTCGTLGTRPCAIFDLDEGLGTLGAGDTSRFRQLLGKTIGPKCPTCPLPCEAGTTGTCN